MARFSKGLKAAVLSVVAAGTLTAGGCTTQEMEQIFGGPSSSPTPTPTATATSAPAPSQPSNHNTPDPDQNIRSDCAQIGARDQACKALGERDLAKEKAAQPGPRR